MNVTLKGLTHNPIITRVATDPGDQITIRQRSPAGAKAIYSTPQHNDLGYHCSRCGFHSSVSLRHVCGGPIVLHPLCRQCYTRTPTRSKRTSQLCRCKPDPNLEGRGKPRKPDHRRKPRNHPALGQANKADIAGDGPTNRSLPDMDLFTGGDILQRTMSPLTDLDPAVLAATLRSAGHPSTELENYLTDPTTFCLSLVGSPSSRELEAAIIIC